MQQNQETQTNSSANKSFDSDKAKSSAAGDVREGQEDSSILHDKKDPNKELSGTVDKDNSSTSQEEFIDDDANTKKDNDS